MTVEEYFEEWWTSKELPENGFNKTAMLDFAEMYHKKALRIHDVVGQSELLKAFVEWQIQGNIPYAGMFIDEHIRAYFKSL
jgi:hypothetical protein